MAVTQLGSNGLADSAITTTKIASSAVATASHADASITPAKMANSGRELGMRNMFINGNFDIWQRGTSYTYPGGIWLYGHADRWGGHFDASIAGSWSRSTNVPNSNSTYSMRVAGQTSGSSAYLDQRVEAVNGRAALAAGSITVSGWIKRTGNAASSVSLNLITPTALDNYASYNSLGAIFTANNTISGNGTASASTLTLTTADTWYYFTLTDTSWASRTGVANGAQVFFSFGGLSTTGSYYEVSQMQLEAGPTATPFEYRSYGAELVLCQRYYSKSYNDNVVPGTATQVGMEVAGFQGASGLGGAYGNVKFPVKMRTTPGTINIWDGAGTANTHSYTYGGAGSAQGISNGGSWWGSGTPFNTSHSGFFMRPTGSQASAWNYVHYTADAEL